MPRRAKEEIPGLRLLLDSLPEEERVHLAKQGIPAAGQLHFFAGWLRGMQYGETHRRPGERNGAIATGSVATPPAAPGRSPALQSIGGPAPPRDPSARAGKPQWGNAAPEPAPEPPPEGGAPEPGEVLWGGPGTGAAPDVPTADWPYIDGVAVTAQVAVFESAVVQCAPGAQDQAVALVREYLKGWPAGGYTEHRPSNWEEEVRTRLTNALIRKNQDKPVIVQQAQVADRDGGETTAPDFNLLV